MTFSLYLHPQKYTATKGFEPRSPRIAMLGDTQGQQERFYMQHVKTNSGKQEFLPVKPNTEVLKIAKQEGTCTQQTKV